MANITLLSDRDNHLLEQSSQDLHTQPVAYHPYTLDSTQKLASFVNWNCKRIQDDWYNFQNVDQICLSYQNVLNKISISMLCYI